MRDLQGSEITFAVVGGVFGVGRLATMLKGQWIRDGSGLGTSATGLTFGTPPSGSNSTPVPAGKSRKVHRRPKYGACAGRARCADAP
jgi:hypothetical protein